MHKWPCSMDNITAFDENEIKAFPQKGAGEALGKWVRTSEEESFNREKKELCAMLLHS